MVGSESEPQKIEGAIKELDEVFTLVDFRLIHL
jgi:hypothetical protein